MRPMLRPLLLPAMLLGSGPAPAQVPPTPAEVAAYRDLHAAAARDDADAIRRLAAAGAYLNARDGNGRTPLSTSPSSRVTAPPPGRSSPRAPIPPSSTTSATTP